MSKGGNWVVQRGKELAPLRTECCRMVFEGVSNKEITAYFTSLGVGGRTIRRWIMHARKGKLFLAQLTTILRCVDKKNKGTIAELKIELADTKERLNRIFRCLGKILEELELY